MTAKQAAMAISNSRRFTAASFIDGMWRIKFI